MYYIYFVWVLCAIPIGYFNFRSVEYDKLEKELGPEKAKQRVKLYGSLAGDLGMLFLLGLWLLPQPRFTIPILESWTIKLPLINFGIPFVHLILSIPFIVIGIYLIWKALIQMGSELSVEHKRPAHLITDGVFAIIRHPQNFGGAVLHVGMSVLVSGWLSLLVTPILIYFDYLVAAKEETELIRIFGQEYYDYRKQVPMFFPRTKRR
jgi:protein-S-isoprenylcysteine O-methyltransferase Ste14